MNSYLNIRYLRDIDINYIKHYVIYVISQQI